jgi:hypothetical protein
MISWTISSSKVLDKGNLFKNSQSFRFSELFCIRFFCHAYLCIFMEYEFEGIISFSGGTVTKE